MDSSAPGGRGGTIRQATRFTPATGGQPPNPGPSRTAGMECSRFTSRAGGQLCTLRPLGPGACWFGGDGWLRLDSCPLVGRGSWRRGLCSRLLRGHAGRKGLRPDGTHQGQVAPLPRHVPSHSLFRHDRRMPVSPSPHAHGATPTGEVATRPAGVVRDAAEAAPEASAGEGRRHCSTQCRIGPDGFYGSGWDWGS